MRIMTNLLLNILVLTNITSAVQKSSEQINFMKDSYRKNVQDNADRKRIEFAVMNFRRVIATTSFLCLAWSIGLTISSVGGAAATDSSTIVSFDSDRWVCSGKAPVKKQHLGRDSLYLASDSRCHVKDAVFEDGRFVIAAVQFNSR
jgi:hypothetical protein